MTAQDDDPLASIDTLQEAKAELGRLRRELEALDARKLELERMAAKRGVKLSCANIALAHAAGTAALRREFAALRSGPKGLAKGFCFQHD